MKHFAAYIDNPNRRVEVEGVNRITAQRQAAMLLDTKRVHDIILIECTEPLCTVQDLIDDTKENCSAACGRLAVHIAHGTNL